MDQAKESLLGETTQVELGKFENEGQPSPSSDTSNEDHYTFYRAAALLVEDVMENRHTPHLSDHNSMRFYRFYHMRFVSWVIKLFIFLNLFIATFEYPRPVTPYEKTIFRSCCVCFQRGFTEFIELCCLAVYCLELYIKYRFMGRKSFLDSRTNLVYMACVVATFIEVLVALSVDEPFVRVTRFMRPFFLVQHVPLLLSACHSALHTVKRMVDVLLLILMLIFVYDVYGNMLFDAVEEDTYFRGLVKGFESLFVLLTTANYPDVMMPAYTANWLYFFFFLSFLAIGLYFLANLTLAVVYNHYREHLKLEIVDRVRRQRAMLREAFALMDTRDTGYVEITQWVLLFKFLRPSWELDRVRLLFSSVDVSGNNKVSLAEWYTLPEMLSIRLHRHDIEVINFWQKYIPNVYKSRPSRILKDVVRHDAFEGMMYLIIIVNVIVTVVVVQMRYLNKKHGDNRHADTLDTLTLIDRWLFGSIFFAEMIAKIYAYGYKEYYNNAWFRYDGFVVVCTVLFLLYSAIEENSDQQNYVSLLRILRCVRLIVHIPRYTVIFKTLFQILPALSMFSGVMLCLFYEYALLGMALYKDKNLEPAIDGTVYSSADYFQNNFNHFSTSMVVLFELLVVNNWQITMNGYIAVTSEWTMVFFMSFYILGVMIIGNLVIAFILEAFVLQYELNLGERSHIDPVSAVLARKRGNMLIVMNEKTQRLQKWAVQPIRTANVTLQHVFSEEIQEMIQSEEGEGVELGDDRLEVVFELQSLLDKIKAGAPVEFSLQDRKYKFD